MATISVRDVARRCLGITGGFSVDRDLYGYGFRDTDGSVFGTLGTNDMFPGTGQATGRSLTRHLETISGEAVDLCLILVDHENDFSGAVDRDDVTKVQYAVQVMRDLYAQQNLGVRRLDWRRIPKADAGAYADIEKRPEGVNMADAWSGPAGSLDVFLVQSIGDADGWSHSGGAGSCNKDAVNDDLTGVLVELGQARRFTGIILGHEVGHYLGLGHTTSTANMMGDDSDGDGIGAIGNSSTAISDAEGTTMRSHCSVLPAC